MSEYSEKFKNPRWQKIRLKVLERDNWTCQNCSDTKETLHVHHRYYEKDKEPWEYPLESLVTLCELCHESEREIRKEYEQTMLYSLREKFLADDVFELAVGFHMMKTLDSPRIIANAFALALTDEKTQKMVLDVYYKTPRYKRSQKRK